jgi:hypothetical protein
MPWGEPLVRLYTILPFILKERGLDRQDRRNPLFQALAGSEIEISDLIAPSLQMSPGQKDHEHEERNKPHP